MNKNELRFNNEMNLVKDGTRDSIAKVMKMMYHDLGYHRKDSLLHSYDLIGKISHHDVNSQTNYILGVAFLTPIYDKYNLTKLIQSRLNDCKHGLKIEKAERSASHYLANKIYKALNHIQDTSKVDIDDTLVLLSDKLNRTLKSVGSDFAIKYDNNRLTVLEHELNVLKHNDFNTTLYTFIPRNSFSIHNPTLRKPKCNPKIEYSHLIHFDGLSQSKAKKVIQLRQFKAKHNVDFTPTTIDDLKHSFKEWFSYFN